MKILNKKNLFHYTYSPYLAFVHPNDEAKTLYTYMAPLNRANWLTQLHDA